MGQTLSSHENKTVMVKTAENGYGDAGIYYNLLRVLHSPDDPVR